jgi:hypothetical protein
MACPYLIFGPDGKPELEDYGGYKYGYGCDDDPEVIKYNKMTKKINKTAKKYYNNILEEYYLVSIILNFLALEFNYSCSSSKEIDETVEKYDTCEKMLNHCANLCDTTYNGYKYYDDIAILLDTYINDAITQNYHICKCMYKFQGLVDNVNCQYILYNKFINFIDEYEVTNTDFTSKVSRIYNIRNSYLINYVPKILSVLRNHCAINTIDVYLYNFDEIYDIYFRHILNCFLDRKQYITIQYTNPKVLHGNNTRIAIFNMKNIKQFVPPPTFYEYLGLVENDVDFCRSIFMRSMQSKKIDINGIIFNVNHINLFESIPWHRRYK